jgi:hypothetical protein
VGLFKDWAEKGKAAVHNVKVRFSPDTRPGPPIVPPTREAIAGTQINPSSGVSTDNPRSRSGSTASGSLYSFSSDSTEIVPVPLSPLESLRKSFHSVNQFWGKSSQKNISIRAEHKEAFEYILHRIESGDITDNPLLRDKSDEEIIEQLLDDWSTSRLVKNAAAQGNSSSGFLWNPITFAVRSVHVAASSVKQVFVTPVNPAVPTDENQAKDFKTYLNALFKAPLAEIKKEASSNILLKLARWPTGLIVSPRELGIGVKGKRLSETVLIQPCVEQLARVYQKAVQDFDEQTFRENPTEFFTGACLALHTYYYELKKVNGFLQGNRNNAYLWRSENLQKALSYYFEQGRVLYEIHAMIQNVPMEARLEKITLMGRYETYIKDLYAREQPYARTHGPFAFGYDKWTKIEAAMEQYRYLRGLPQDIHPEPSADRLTLMHYAGEQGRLKNLKAQGLYLGYGQGEDAEDPFIPLPLPTRLTPLRL